MDLTSRITLTTEEQYVWQMSELRYDTWFRSYAKEASTNCGDDMFAGLHLILDSAIGDGLRALWERQRWRTLFEVMTSTENLYAPTLNWYKLLVELLIAQLEDAKLKHSSASRHRLAKAHYELGCEYFYGSPSETFFRALRLDRVEEAVREYEEALLCEPKNVEIRYHLMCVLGPHFANRPEDQWKQAIEMLMLQPTEARSFSESPQHYFTLWTLSSFKDMTNPETRRVVLEELKTIASSRRGIVYAHRELERLKRFVSSRL